MGTSFVDIAGKGFWIRDGVLEVFLRFLSLHLVDPSNQGSEHAEIRNRWLLASRGFFNGSIPTALEKAVSTETGKKIVLDAIASLLTALKNGPDSIDKNTLNLMGFETRWHKNFESARLIEVGKAFILLINGEIEKDASDTSFMPGCWIE